MTSRHAIKLGSPWYAINTVPIPSSIFNGSRWILKNIEQGIVIVSLTETIQQQNIHMKHSHQTRRRPCARV